MINQVAERTIARVLGIGSAFVSIIVVTGTVTDPVNVTKLFALGGIAVGAEGARPGVSGSGCRAAEAVCFASTRAVGVSISPASGGGFAGT